MKSIAGRFSLVLIGLSLLLYGVIPPDEERVKSVVPPGTSEHLTTCAGYTFHPRECDG